jgi:rhodanese-related sulfurtransferase
MTKIKDISPTAALALTRKGVLLVDVRQPHEVAKRSFDVPDLLLIPLNTLELRFREIPPERQVIIACNSGNRSLVAARFLADHGYRKVMNMQYGISRWEKEGLPVRRKPNQNPFSWLLQMFRRKP